VSRRERNIPGNGKILTGLTSYSKPTGQKQEVRGNVVEWRVVTDEGERRESTKSEG
jgi:hypothetical protein